MRVANGAAILLALAFVVVQLIPAPRTNPPGGADPEAPAVIVRLLRRACYDCHSNQTRWPWYSHLAPGSWLISRHVAEARRRLNFSEWQAYSSDPDTASHKLGEIAEQVSNGKMAPWYYRAMHPAARLSHAERQELIRWARASSAALRTSD
jgi:heme-binding protein